MTAIAFAGSMWSFLAGANGWRVLSPKIAARHGTFASVVAAALVSSLQHSTSIDRRQRFCLEKREQGRGLGGRST